MGQTKISVEPYSIAPVCQKSRPEYFYRGDISKICTVLETVIFYESPIHKEEAERRAVQYWGIGAVGSRVRAILREAALMLVREKKIKKKGDFYWAANMELPKIRNRETADVSKKIEYIAPEEIREAAMFVLRKEYSAPRDSLINKVANLLGIRRVSEQTAEYVWDAIKIYKKEKKIAEIDGRLVVASISKSA